jgi:hypothetical protein
MKHFILRTTHYPSQPTSQPPPPTAIGRPSPTLSQHASILRPTWLDPPIGGPTVTCPKIKNPPFVPPSSARTTISHCSMYSRRSRLHVTLSQPPSQTGFPHGPRVARTRRLSLVLLYSFPMQTPAETIVNLKCEVRTFLAN